MVHHGERQFVGREHEWTVLSSALDASASGHGSCVVITGPSGIGKSALLEAAHTYAERSGFLVIGSAARRLEEHRPLGALLDLVEEIELAGSGTDRTVRLSADIGAEFVAAEQIADRLAARATGRPLLVSVDDAHWADRSTQHCLRVLTTCLVRAGACVIYASRPPSPDHPLHRYRSPLPSPVHWLEVAPMSGIEIRELAATRASHLSDEDLDQVVRRAGGVPLLAEALTQSPTTQAADDPIRAMLGELEPQSARVLGVAAVIGGNIDVATTCALAAVTAIEFAAVLTDAEQIGFVTRDGGWRFRHDLFQDVLYNSIDVDVRRALHCEAARLLAAAGRDTDRVAEHFIRGAQPGDQEAVAFLHGVAARAASTSPRAALALFDAAIELCGPREPSLALLADQLRARAWTGDLEGAEETARWLLGRDMPPELEYRVHHELAFTTYARCELGATLRHLDAVDATAPTPALRARALAERSFPYSTAGDHDGSVRAARAALDAALRCGDVPAAALAHASLMMTAGFRLDYAVAREHLRSVRHLVSGPGGAETAVYQPMVLAALFALESDHPDAETLIHQGRQSAVQSGTVWGASMCDAIAATASFRRGELADCGATALAGAELNEEAGVFIAGGWCRGLAALVEVLAGDVDKAELHVEAAEALYAGPQSRLGGEWTALARTWILERSGDRTAALRQLRATWEFLIALQVGSSRLHIVADLARLAALEGDTALLGRVVIDADQLAASTDLSVHRALATAVRGWADGDIAALDAAADSLLAGRSRTAGALVRAGSVDLARATGGSELRSRVDTAVRELVALGAFTEADRIGRGIPGTRRRRSNHGWEALTETELRVVALVERGRSNPEIASELFVSRRTIESHVSSALRKLGARSRVELAVLSAERSDRATAS